jgi:hypothetical protein
MLTPLLLLVQASIPSIGDTVWVERTLGQVGTAVVRPQVWSLGTLGQQLGPASVRLTPEGTLVRYPLVIWYPGEHVLTMPGPVVVRRDGRSDTLAAGTVRVRVESVLPLGANRAELPPRPASVPLPLEARAWLPLLVLLALVLAGMTLVALRWRRRGRARVHRPVELRGTPPEALATWVRSGEYRAALHEWAWVLAGRLRTSQDLAETAELQKLLDEISLHSFSPRSSAVMAALCERAARLAAA